MTTRERPIILHTHEVRAALDGRLTQVRRPVKHRENRWEVADCADGKLWPYWPCYVYGEPEPVLMACPFGSPGSKLWVKETFGYLTDYDGQVLLRADRKALYRADVNQPTPSRWRPSTQMPRWASRLTLEIVSVRVERVGEIGEEDAVACGFTGHYSAAYVSAGEIVGPDGVMPSEEFKESTYGSLDGWTWVMGVRGSDYA